MSGSLIPGSSPDRVQSPTSVTETVNGSHQFVIQGYRLTKGMGVGKYIASDNFWVGGYQWGIFFYPDGKDQEDNSAFVSVFIALVSEGTEVRALFELTLVDQTGNGKHKVEFHFEPYTLKNRGSMWGYKRFFNHSLLETSDFLKDDCLIINCTVGVMVPVIHCPQLHCVHVPDSELASDFGVLLDSMEGSDVTFNISDEKILAHKLVLAARSRFFKSMFSKTSNREVTINDLEPNVFKALLQYMYKDSLLEDVEPATAHTFERLNMSEIYETLIVKVLAAADKYDLKRLRLLCESHICKGLSVKSVAKILALADRYNAKELKNVCLKFTTANLVAVLATDAYKQMKDDCLSLQYELLKAVAGDEEGSNSIEGAKSQSVWPQLSDGSGDNNSQHVRQRTN